MAFELSFGRTSGLTALSAPFVIPDADLTDRLTRWLSAAGAMPFRYDIAQDTNLSFGTQSPEPSLAGLYELFVPAGASRWAVFRGLMHRADVAALIGTGAASVYYDSSGGIPSLTAGTLRMSVDGVTTITRRMYLLPPQPAFGLNGGADLYVVTLVDGRYFAQFGSVGSAANGLTSWTAGTPPQNSWEGMIDGAVINATGSASLPTFYGTWPPESVYGQPELDSDFYAFAGRPGPMSDSALACTGRVLCAGPDPLYTVIRWADANAFAAAARAANAAERRAGGSIFSGYADLALVAHLPSSIQVQFPNWHAGYGYDTCGNLAGGHGDDADPRTHSADGEYGLSTAVNVTRASLGAPYATMPADTTTSGIALNLRTTAKALYAPDGTWDAANQTQCNNLAAQLAKDFYDSQLQSLTETYRGLIAFDARAALDVVYSYWPEPMTRVSRRPLNDYPTRFGHGFGDQSAPHRVQICQVTGPISGGYYPALIAPGGSTISTQVVYLFPTNGEALLIGTNYKAVRSQFGSHGSPAKAVYFTAETPPLAVGTTPVSGGTTGGVLYSNGSTLQSSGNLLIAGGGNMPSIQAATNKWISFSIGSN